MFLLTLTSILLLLGLLGFLYFRKAKYNKNVFILLLILLTLTLWGGFKSNYNPMSKMMDLKDVNIDQLEKFSGGYVGDNSRISAILANLPGNVSLKNISLVSNSINVNYGIKEGSGIKRDDFLTFWLNDDRLEKFFLHNSTVLFILVKNVESITIHINEGISRSFQITRQDLEAFYNSHLLDYAQNKGRWKKEVLSKVNSPSVRKQFYTLHPIHED